MYHLVYVSSATVQMTEEELIFLLNQSRKVNKEFNITGMLLYCDGNFFQVLEGDQKDVEKIYKRIENDSRNWGNMVLLRETKKRRAFPGWSMGFKNISPEHLDDLEGYSDFLQNRETSEKFKHQGPKVLKLLHRFKKNNSKQ